MMAIRPFYTYAAVALFIAILFRFEFDLHINISPFNMSLWPGKYWRSHTDVRPILEPSFKGHPLEIKILSHDPFIAYISDLLSATERQYLKDLGQV